MAKGKKNEEVIVEAPVVEEVITPAKHPLAEKLTTIGEQITASGMFLNHASFIEDLSDWIAQDRGRFEGYSMRQIFEDFSDHSQMFVTEKDNISDLVTEKLEAEVKTIRKSTEDKHTLQIIKNGKKQTIYVENKEGEYFWGIGNMEIDKL